MTFFSILFLGSLHGIIEFFGYFLFRVFGWKSELYALLLVESFTPVQKKDFLPVDRFYDISSLSTMHCVCHVPSAVSTERKRLLPVTYVYV